MEPLLQLGCCVKQKMTHQIIHGCVKKKITEMSPMQLIRRIETDFLVVQLQASS